MELSYAGLSLQLIKTRRFTQEAIYDASSTDYLYTHFVWEGQCVFNPAATSYDTNLNPNSVLPAATCKNIRQTLLTPRGSLNINVNGVNLLTSPLALIPGVGTVQVDAKNGPKPIRCDVTQVAGQNTFLVDYAIETWLVECPNVSNPPAILTNRWSQHHVVNDQHMTTVITEGIAYFRTDVLTALSQTPDFFRNVVLPPVPKWTRRSSIEVQVSEDNSMMKYTVIDIETFYSLGALGGAVNKFGAIKFEAIYEVSSQVPSKDDDVGAASYWTQHKIICKAYGNKASTKWNLTIFCLQIIVDKLQIDPADTNKSIVMHAAITHYLHDKIAEVEFVVLRPPLKGGVDAVTSLDVNKMHNESEKLAVEDGNNLTNPGSGFNPQPPNDSDTRGTFKPFIACQKLEQACTPIVRLSIAGISAGSNTDTYMTDSPTVVVLDTLLQNTFPSSPSLYTTNQTQANFLTAYRVDTSYNVDYHTMVAPVAYSTPGGTRTPCEYVTSATPTSKMIVRWTGERVGSVPMIPNPILSNSNFVLLETSLPTVAPIIMPDGYSIIYRVSGKYTYGAITYQGAGDQLPLGVLPWTTLNYNQTQIQTSDYIHGIIDNGSQLQQQGNSQSNNFQDIISNNQNNQNRIPGKFN